MAGEQQDIALYYASEGSMGTGTVLAEGGMGSDRRHATESTLIVVTFWGSGSQCLRVCVSVASPGKGELFRTDVHS